MAFILELPEGYSYVLAVATSAFFVNNLHFFLTARARKASGLKYPIPYASQEQAAKDPAAYKFNCAQRAHSNFTENLVPAVGSLVIAGLRYPIAASTLGGIWVISRIIYAIGYVSSKGPQGRLLGAAGQFLADMALKLTAAYTVTKLVLQQ